MLNQRKSFQGVWNIIRFNWHFYLLIVGITLVGICVMSYLSQTGQMIMSLFLISGICSTFLSILASWVVYDYSGLYRLDFMPDLSHKKVLILHAGFDEISNTLKNKFPSAEIQVADFYDPNVHREISIKRARKIYPNPSTCIPVQAQNLPFPDDTFDQVILFFAAHEIRLSEERALFFQQLNRVLVVDGSITMVEHMRDWKNFIVYNIGFFHFYSLSQWLKTFRASDFEIAAHQNLSIFVHHFSLIKHDPSS